MMRLWFFLIRTQQDKGGSVTADEIGLPVSATGGILPCGATAIWKI